MPDEEKLEQLEKTIDEARRQTGETRQDNGDDEQKFIDRGEQDDTDDVDNAIAPPG